LHPWLGKKKIKKSLEAILKGRTIMEEGKWKEHAKFPRDKTGSGGGVPEVEGP